MEFDCKKIKNGLVEFMSSNLKVEKTVNGCRVTTPFLTLNNDSIKLFVEDQGSGRARLTDLGDTLSEFDMIGFDYKSSPKRKKMIEDLLSTSGLHQVDNSIEMSCQFDEVPYAVNKFVSGLNSVKHLRLLETPYERFNFAEEVHKALQSRNMVHEYQEPIQILGIPFKIDLRIPVSKANDYGSCIQTFYSEEKRESVAKAKTKTYPFLLLPMDEKVRARRLSIVENRDSWADNALTLIDKSSDEVYDWAERDKILASLA